jgi:hypothetical protein
MGAVTGEVVGLGDAKTLGLVVRFWPMLSKNAMA